jgi:penicillin-binding protein 1B
MLTVLINAVLTPVLVAGWGTGRPLGVAGAGLASTLSVAGKTGTTNDQRDSWFAGYTGSHVGVIWVGADDNQPMPITGATGALPVWRSIFANVKTTSIARTQPNEIEYYWVDSHSGLLSAETCRGALLLPFVKGTEPRDKAACQSVQPNERSWWQRFWRR